MENKEEKYLTKDRKIQPAMYGKVGVVDQINARKNNTNNKTI